MNGSNGGNGTTTEAVRRAAGIAPRLRVLLALALTACAMEDCENPLSDSARNGEPQVLRSVTYDTAFSRTVPAVVYRDSLQVVRILADTIRLNPAAHSYRRRTIYGVSIGGGGEARQGTSPEWVTRTMYEVGGFDDYVVLDSFIIAPGLPPGSAYWDSNGGELANVRVQREVHADSANATRREAFSGAWLPARR